MFSHNGLWRKPTDRRQVHCLPDQRVLWRAASRRIATIQSQSRGFAAHFDGGAHQEVTSVVGSSPPGGGLLAARGRLLSQPQFALLLHEFALREYMEPVFSDGNDNRQTHGQSGRIPPHFDRQSRPRYFLEHPYSNRNANSVTKFDRGMLGLERRMSAMPNPCSDGSAHQFW